MTPLNDAERASFKRYAQENSAESDGTKSHWAHYTLRLLEDLDKRREDDALAAGELLMPMPEPGTDLARVMAANKIGRRVFEGEVERISHNEKTWRQRSYDEEYARKTVANDLSRLREAVEEAKAAMSAEVVCVSTSSLRLPLVRGLAILTAATRKNWVVAQDDRLSPICGAKEGDV